MPALPFRSLCAKLRTAISAMHEIERDALAPQFGKALRRIKAEQTVNANDFLQLCARVGIDPVEGKRVQPNAITAPLNLTLLGICCTMQRHWHNLDQRDAAKKIGISAASICRAEKGTPVSIEATLAICAFAKVHPFDFLREGRRAV